jgi:uncharacterized protein (TIGR00303 family)
MDIEIHGNQENGNSFVNRITRKRFLFSFVISYTETCEIPGITIAGANLDLVKFTSPADAEFLHYGYCKSIDKIPMTPDGKPTPAIISKVAMESASIPHIVINAGSMRVPKLPYLETNLNAGKNIMNEPAMDNASVLQAVDYGRIIGRMLASFTDCLVIGESIPGGTTTALAVMKGLGLDAKVSSSMPQNPMEIKNKVVNDAIRRLDSKEPFDVVANMGDPMIPLVAGMISSASEITNVLLAGGTQMAAVLAFGKSLGYNPKNIAVGTTSYIIKDETADFVNTMKKISETIPILVVDLKLDGSSIAGLRSFSDGFVKEGAGAGGTAIAAILKTGINSQKLLELVEKEYQRLITSQSPT